MSRLLESKVTDERLQFWIGVFLVFVSSVSFSAKSVFAKLAYQDITDSVTILMLRMAFALPFFLYVAHRPIKIQYKFQKKDYIAILGLGIIGYYLASLFDFWGLEFIPAGMERLILFIYPTLVVLISSVLYKRKPEKKEVLALMITYSGIVLVFINEQILFRPLFLWGSFLVFLSALCYAIYLIGSERIIPKIGASRYTAYALSISGICIIIHFLVARDIQILSSIQPRTYFLCLLMAIISTVIPTFLLTQGIKRIGSGKSAIVGTIGPVSTIVLAYFFLGEKIGLTEVLGTGLIIAGVLVIGKK